MKEQLRDMEGRLTGTNIQLVEIPEEENINDEKEVISKEIIPEVFQY